MPYDRTMNFTPDNKFKFAWSLVPKNGNFRLPMEKLTAPKMYDELSSIIPLFYLLTLLAILFDIYLGVFVLSKSGVNIALIIASIVFDIFLAAFVYIFASVFERYNDVKNKNLILIKRLQIKTRERNESDNDFGIRKRKLNREIKELKSKLFTTKILKYIAFFILAGIAYWKIYTYMSVLPPSLSIWATIRGKIVIIMAILTAVFHAIATENTTAALWFNHIKNKKLKEFEEQGLGALESREDNAVINYEAKFVPKELEYIKLVEGENGYEIRYKNDIIWDSDILKLIQVQTDDNAKRAIAIVCKEVQCQ